MLVERCGSIAEKFIFDRLPIAPDEAAVVDLEAVYNEDLDEGQ